jgi:hypothetical protein
MVNFSHPMPRLLTPDYTGREHGRGLAEDQSPPCYARVAVDGDHRARGRGRFHALCRVRTRSASRITSPSSRRCRIAAFPSSGNTVRRWRALPGNCRPGSSSRARCGRMLPPRTHGGDWFCRSRRACAGCAGVLCTLHARLSNRVHSFYVELDPIAEGKPAEPVIELKPVSPAQNDLAVRRALETAGVEFIDGNGGGPGVRLRKRPQPKKG